MRISRKIPREMLPRDGSRGPTRRGAAIHPLQVLRQYPSVLMGCIVPCESKGELNHWLTIDADGSIAAARAQPDAILWDDGGVQRRHIPDAEVRFHDGRTVIREVKALSELSKEDRDDLERRTEIVRADLASEGLDYEVIDSTCPAFLRRVTLAEQILVARRRVASRELQVLAREAVLLHGAATLGDLQRLIPSVDRDDLLALVLCRLLVIDLGSAPLSEETRVRLLQANTRAPNR